MKQFKGTQKDWSEVGHNDNGIFIGGKDSLGAICHVYFKNNEVSAEEGRANASLIANAKQMYDFIEYISRRSDDDGLVGVANRIINYINNES